MYTTMYGASTLAAVERGLTLTLKAGDIAWMLTSTALVLLMIPGVG